MKKPKKVPMRMCVGCREMKEKSSLIRVVKTAEDGSLTVDRRGKVPGRGAYICPSEQCLSRARKIKALERALELQISAEMYEALGLEVERRIVLG